MPDLPSLPSTHRPSTARRPLAALLAVALLALGALSAPAPAGAVQEYSEQEREQIATLTAKYKEWLETVKLIITDEEVTSFLALEKDYQRDAFIDRFWRVRDKFTDTARNEFQERYEQRVNEAKQVFGGLEEDRSVVLLLNGYPTARIEARCTQLLRPLEVWYYDGSDTVHFKFFVIFYREGSRYRLWRPYEGIERLQDNLASASVIGGGYQTTGQFLRAVVQNCRDGEAIATGINYVLREGPLSYDQILGRIQETPQLAGREWVETFNSYSTDLPPDAELLDGKLTLAFPGRRQSRTAVQGTVSVPRAEAGVAKLADARSYNFILIGELLSDDELFDSFRYKFDLPAPEVTSEHIPLVFQRFLRPGDYKLVLRVEDLNGERFFREERDLSVPKVEEALPPPPMDEETARLLAEANAALARGDVTVQLIEPRGQLHTGYLRFETLTTGDIDHVTFSLDGDELLTKRSPPFSVDLDLGSVPQPRTLSAVAYDARGEELASDDMLLNAGGHRFAVDLVEPRKGKHYERSLSAEAQVEVPEGQSVERVELYLNETRVATLYQEPWVQPIVLPQDSPIAYVRAVAYLPDGNSTEDLVFVNAPDYLEEIDVQFVEVYASVLDRDGHPVEGLTENDFQVLEDGVPQNVVRFEQVRDLPIHAGILLDVSASMEESLDATQQAALSFFEQTIQPKDRAAVITFNDHPNVVVKFTNDVKSLAGGLAGLSAERGTSLYDSVIFALYYFNGIKGQKTLLILSDGKDESSRFSWDQTLEYARRAGVAIYSIALRDKDAHKKLTKLAEATGGRSFLVQDASELPGVYETVERDLRSKYLLAYQSSNTENDKDFRNIKVVVDRPGTEVQAMQGYYP
jgi:Ca-activated chloride channel family protein